ncbi:MAG: hypothetical protein JO016_16365 [Actinobacteria bacterium]|nr:hypothetical protein [Actinomycetota bacterium]
MRSEHRGAPVRGRLAVLAGLIAAVAACATGGPARVHPSHPVAAGSSRPVAASRPATTPVPAAPPPGLRWRPAGRRVGGRTALYETTLVPPGGPDLSPGQLAQLLIRAGSVRAMELDINPAWPVFASYRPASPTGLAAPSNAASCSPASTTARARSSTRPGRVTSSPCRLVRAAPDRMVS